MDIWDILCIAVVAIMIIGSVSYLVIEYNETKDFCNEKGGLFAYTDHSTCLIGDQLFMVERYGGKRVLIKTGEIYDG